MAKEQLSDKQQQILEFIKRRILDKGYPPAVREICEAVNLRSTSSVHSHLETLERKGYIHRDPTKPRAIEITDDDYIEEVCQTNHIYDGKITEDMYLVIPYYK